MTNVLEIVLSETTLTFSLTCTHTFELKLNCWICAIINTNTIEKGCTLNTQHCLLLPRGLGNMATTKHCILFIYFHISRYRQYVTF